MDFKSCSFLALAIWVSSICNSYLEASSGGGGSNECAWHWQISANESIKFVGRKRCLGNRFCCGTCHRRYCCNETDKRLTDQTTSCGDLFCGGFYYFKTSGVSAKHPLVKCNSNTSSSERHICSGSCQEPRCLLADSSALTLRLDVDSCITSKVSESPASPTSEWLWLIILILMAITVALCIALLRHFQKKDNYCRPLNRPGAQQQRLLGSLAPIMSISSHSLPDFIAHPFKSYDDEPPSYESLWKGLRTSMRNLKESVRLSRESLSSQPDDKS